MFIQVGKEVAHPGVANDFNEEGAQKYYTYYQWVCFVLFFQVSLVIKLIIMPRTCFLVVTINIVVKLYFSSFSVLIMRLQNKE